MCGGRDGEVSEGRDEPEIEEDREEEEVRKKTKGGKD